MKDVLLVVGCWLFEPKVPADLAVQPKAMADTADESQSSGPRPGLSICDDLFHEAFVLGSFSVVQWRALHDLSGREPNKSLRTKKSTRKIEIDFIRKPVREDFVQVLGNVGSCGVMRMVIKMSRSCDCERKR